jgi:hypothetical protein
MTYSQWGALGYLHQQMDAGDAALAFGQTETRGQLQALYRMVHELAVTLGVAMDVLRQAGLLDPAAIQAQAAKILADSGGAMIACVQCGKTAPLREATRTPMGAVCAACGGR